MQDLKRYRVDKVLFLCLFVIADFKEQDLVRKYKYIEKEVD
ncbi:hypothetical protein [Clostridium beijerinckii]|nr:hypothetical protein [Clostridium beijerinckii]